jgi:hypothetical protein
MHRHLLFGLMMMLALGCGLVREPSKTPRTAIEQLMLSHAVSRSLNDLAIPLESDASVMVEATGFFVDRTFLQGGDSTESAVPMNGTLYTAGSDLPMVRSFVEGRLGELGYRLQSRREEARYRVRVMVQALGTEQGVTFFGMPPVQSVIIPFALPELTLFKLQNQRAYTRLSLDIFETATGRLVRSTPWYVGSSYYNQYTILFFIYFRTTDLVLPP